MNLTGKIESFRHKLKAVMAMPAFPVLLALCAAHSLNDLLQSVITAVYPMLKEDLNLDFAQIGLITLVYQIAASIFQPVVGFVFDKRPFVHSLPMGMISTSLGIIMFSYCSTMTGILVARGDRISNAPSRGFTHHIPCRKRKKRLRTVDISGRRQLRRVDRSAVGGIDRSPQRSSLRFMVPCFLHTRLCCYASNSEMV